MIIIIITGNLWHPNLESPGRLQKADKHILFKTHTHIHPDTPTHTCTHTYTHTPQKHKHSSHGFDGNKKESDKSVGKREEVGFSFDMKEESDACLTEKGREFQMTGTIY